MRRLFQLAVLPAFLLLPGEAQGTVFGADFVADALLRIDLDTGTISTVGPLAFSFVRELTTKDDDHTLYAFDEDTDTLLIISPATGNEAAVGSIDMQNPNNRLLSLTYDPRQGLFLGTVSALHPGTFYGHKNAFVKIDPETAALQVIGSVPSGRLDALQFDAAGTLWGVQGGTAKLFVVDPATGATAFSRFMQPTPCFITDVGGILETGLFLVMDVCGSAPGFYSLNVETGELTLLSPRGLLDRIDIAVLEEAIEIVIDIRPGDEENKIRPDSRAVIPVGIITTSVDMGDARDFDAWEVDPSTIEFGPNGATILHAAGHAEDVDGDGDLDMVVHFRGSDTGIVCGDTEALLKGETFTGTPVVGTDNVNTAGCK